MAAIRLLAAAASLALLATPALARDHWIASWGAGSVKLAGETIAAPGVTYRNITHVSLGGKRVRLTLSNRFGTGPLVVGGASVGLSKEPGGLVDGAARAVTFGGKARVVIAPGAVILSDPVAIEVPPLGNLAVSVFLPAQTVSFYTGHAISHQTNYRAAGNQLLSNAMPGATTLMPWRVVMAVDVAGPANGGTIVAFGDSITDGTGTTDNANLRWPDQLAARLQADPRLAHLAVVDEGIGGNRILHSGGEPGARAGEHPSGVARWAYDALDRSGVKYVVLLEGVNDIGRSSMIRESGAQARAAAAPEAPVSAEDLIRAMTQLIDQAHAKGVKVIGATLTPFGGANYERPDGEAARTAINEFIRHGGKFDGVIDFDHATQDPDHPLQYRPGFNDRDHLHPNNAGAKAMADSVDLGLFQ